MNSTNLKQLIRKVLKSDNRLWNEDKTELNQTFLLDLAERIDEKVIDLLLQEKELRRKFFVKIKDVYVFKTNDFRFFMEENKVDNSYTAYKNRIGLTDGKRFLKDTNDVVLDFPYKDCVLEGGQSTEEGTDTYFEYDEKAEQYEQKQGKRKEIFFNSVLAHDEIDRLFDAKALTNWKRFTKDGEQEIKEIKRDKDGTIKENLIIKGNNLLSLHSLKKQFAGKIKLIYIDPPYNTGNDEFKYNDNFNHSTWLTFMKNRLEVAREFLREDGIIFVNCDDNEQAYLKVLCDEVFKRDNFISCITVYSNPRGRQSTANIANTHEYLLIYSKTKSGQIKGELLDDEKKAEYRIKDENGYYREIGLRLRGGRATAKESPSLHFPIYVNPRDTEISLENKKGYIKIIPKFEDGILGTWRWSKNKILKDINNLTARIVNAKDGKRWDIFEKDYLTEEKLLKVKSVWFDKEINYDKAAVEIRAIFGSKAFKYSKPVPLIKKILRIGSDDGSLVLDFFSGSGTTAQAVLEVNKEDGGNRQFILCEQLDYVDTVTVPRVQKVIEKLGGGDFIYFELAKWNETAKEKILACESLDELIAFFDEMYERYFLNYNLKIKEFREKVIKEEEFKNLSLEEQKKIFIAMLDNNQMYVNKTEMEDKRFGISEKDQKLTKNFYNSEK